MSASKKYKRNETAAKAKDPPAIVHPDDHPATNMGLMQQSMQEMKLLTRPANTQKAYDPKALEYWQFCDFHYLTEEAALCYILTTEKVYAFMWYQSLRETKQGKKARKEADGVMVHFNAMEYEEVMTREKMLQSDKNQKYEPKMGVGISVMLQYKAALMDMWKHQVDLFVLCLSWDLIWTSSCEVLMKYVGSKKVRQSKKNDHEKVDKNLSAMQIVGETPVIKRELYRRSCYNSKADLRDMF